MAAGLASHKLRIFISYGREDITNDFAEKLYKDLKANGYEPILDTENFQAGQQLSDVISDKIANCHVMLVILSKKYSKSNWCCKELVFAEQHKKRMIIIKREDNCEVSNQVQLIIADRLDLSFIRDDQYSDNFTELKKPLEKVSMQ